MDVCIIGVNDVRVLYCGAQVKKRVGQHTADKVGLCRNPKMRRDLVFLYESSQGDTNERRSARPTKIKYHQDLRPSQQSVKEISTNSETNDSSRSRLKTYCKLVIFWSENGSTSRHESDNLWKTFFLSSGKFGYQLLDGGSTCHPCR